MTFTEMTFTEIRKKIIYFLISSERGTTNDFLSLFNAYSKSNNEALYMQIKRAIQHLANKNIIHVTGITKEGAYIYELTSKEKALAYLEEQDKTDRFWWWIINANL